LPETFPKRIQPPLKGVDYKIIGTDGREYSAGSVDELRVWIEEKRVGPGTWVWNGSEQRWQPASAWPEFQWDLPVAPPRLPAPPPAPTFQNAEFPLRAAAYLVDTIAIGLLFSLVTLPWADTFQALQKAVETKPDLGTVLRFYALFFGTFIPLRLLYNVGFHGSSGSTPGKMLFGLRVVRSDGSALTFHRALLRFIAELGSIAAFGIGYFIAIPHPERRALHDLVAGTRVVRGHVSAPVAPDKS